MKRKTAFYGVILGILIFPGLSYAEEGVNQGPKNERHQAIHSQGSRETGKNELRSGQNKHEIFNKEKRSGNDEELKPKDLLKRRQGEIKHKLPPKPEDSKDPRHLPPHQHPGGDIKKDVRDRREDFRDKREDIRDKKEDIRDSQHHGGPKDRLEDIRDRREDIRDKKEDVRDRREDIKDRRHHPGEKGKSLPHLQPKHPEQGKPFPQHDKGLHKGAEKGVRDHGEGMGKKTAAHKPRGK